MLEQIIIHGMAVPTIIGVYDWERTEPQTLLLDIVLGCDLKAACVSDNVNDTIDYAKVQETILAVGKESHFELLEALAEKVCRVLFERFPIRSIDLTIVKPNILENVSKVAVRVVRERS